MISLFALVIGCGSNDWQHCKDGYGLNNDDQCVEVVDPSPSTEESLVDDPNVEGDMPDECSDGADNDRDGWFDCDDPECDGAEECQDSDADGGSGVDTAEVEQYHPDGYAGARMHGPDTNNQVENCLECHGADLNGMSGAFPETEVNCNDCHEGKEEWKENCTYCHGGEENSTGAPPREVNADDGEPSSTWTFQVHSVHVADTNMKTGFDCTECHSKPDDVFTLGHVLQGDDTPERSEVDFSGGLSPEGSWSGGTCSDLYCHGDGQDPNGEIEETAEKRECNDCHPYEGDPRSSLRRMSGEHELHLNLRATSSRPSGCAMCHVEVISDYDCLVDADCIDDASLHINKVNDVVFDPDVTPMEYDPTAQTCSEGGFNCHGPEPWNHGGPGGYK